MVREVDLVRYLPPFVAGYEEEKETLEAENPEFRLIWNAVDRTLNNEFIATADEYGISRFESLLHIFPSRQDTLESRRSRVQTRWFNSIPYTWRVFLERLVALCGDHNFTVEKYFTEDYRIELEIELDLFGQIEELERLIETMIPANMICHSVNKIRCEIEGTLYFGGGVCAVDTFLITNDKREDHVITGPAFVGGGVVGAVEIMATNDTKRDFEINGVGFAGGGLSVVHIIKVSDTQIRKDG